MAVPAGWGTADLAVDSGDAFSVSYLHHLKGEAFTVDRAFEGMDPAFLRRALLRVLDGEEYEAIQDHHNAQLACEFETEASGERRVPRYRFVASSEGPEAVAQVRITDLRLAKNLKPKVLERDLKSALPDLPVPVTTDGVMRWKHETLRKPKAMRTAAELGQNEKWYEEEGERIASVSFAAAALCLFLDLGVADVKEAERDGLAVRVRELADLTRELTFHLDKTVDRLSKLLGTGKGGRPPDPDIKYSAALVLYRMGHPLVEVAQRIGLSPVISKKLKGSVADDESRGNKNWKDGLRRAIERGIEVEREKFPVAAEVFSRREDEPIKQQAFELYREYREGHGRVSVADHLPHLHDGDDLLTPRNEGAQRLNALIQLGSCLANRRDPLRPTLD
ncbi:MAG: hypothetical protein M3R38_14690 [Actinomycetota bacterium]|nr:hypothetical protein [Actinomycetota bacterium]